MKYIEAIGTEKDTAGFHQMYEVEGWISAAEDAYATLWKDGTERIDFYLGDELMGSLIPGGEVLDREGRTVMYLGDDCHD